MASGADHTGAMIALVPTDDDLDRLTLEGGEPREELHLTLWFLGEADDIGAETREALVNVVTSMVERRELSPVRARAFGVNHWNPESEDPAWVLAIGDVPEDERDHEALGVYRGAMEEAWHDSAVDLDVPTQHSPWSPHVTIAYSSDTTLVDELKSRLGEVTFDRIRLAFGDEVHDVPLVSSPDTMTATAEVDVAMTGESDHEVECELELDPKHFGSTGGSVVDKPWNGSPSRFTDDEYKRAAAACDSGEGTVKDRCFLPHHEPGGATNRNGVHNAASRVNQVKASSAAKARAKAHLRAHYRQLGEDPPNSLKATAEEETFMVATARDSDCPPGQRKTSDGECVPETDGANEADTANVGEARWTGVLVVEGVTTGDGREFAPDALTWADLPVALRWNIEESHGGIPQTKAVNVGNITEIWRDGNKIMGRGTFDVNDPNGREAHRKVKEGFLKGVSVDVDDVADADVELVFPEDDDGDDEDEGGLELLMPEKIVFHAGRIRAATLCDIPAFVEAYISLDEDAEDGEGVAAAAVTLTSGVVSMHGTDTTDEPWDGDANVRRLPNLLSRGTAQAAFAWVDTSVVRSGHVVKTAGRFLHHMVSEEGEVGAANLTACSSGIGVLNSDRAYADMSVAERWGVYNHLAKHLRDAGKEPPPARFHDDAVIASVVEVDDRPPRAWFEDPKLSVPTPITVTDAGRVYGHAAEWNSCHVGFPDVCVTPPQEDFHPYFMTGEVVCDDGSRVAVGQITVGTGHAPLTYGASRATDHYDNTGTAVADVVVGNDEHGIWVAGAVRPHVDAARVRDLRASGQVSGDWRRIGGQLRLVGLLAVNVPGYPVPRLRARVASGEPCALVAAGRTSVGRPHESQEEIQRRAMRALADSIAHRIGLDRVKTEVDSLVASGDGAKEGT